MRQIRGATGFSMRSVDGTSSVRSLRRDGGDADQRPRASGHETRSRFERCRRQSRTNFQVCMQTTAKCVEQHVMSAGILQRFTRCQKRVPRRDRRSISATQLAARRHAWGPPAVWAAPERSCWNRDRSIRCRGVLVEQAAAKWEQFLALAVGEPSEIANARKPFGQHMLRETAKELLGRHCHPCVAGGHGHSPSSGSEHWCRRPRLTGA